MQKIQTIACISIIAISLFSITQVAMADTANRRVSTVLQNCFGPASGDADFDNICDSWEQTNSLVVTYPSGTSPSYTYNAPCGAANSLDPRCIQPAADGIRDIFVEIDCLSGQCPSTTAMENVIAAFWDKNIRLHLQLDERTLDPATHFSNPTTSFPGTNTSPGFDQIKAAHFGSVNERGTTGWSDNGWKQKQQVFHYALFVSKQTGNTGSSGISELWGNDLMISLGSFSGGVGSQVQQEGTFMHELGHNLNLNHGGGDAINCKPNYLSVLSYTRQMGDLVPTRDLDYSRMAMGPIGSAQKQLSETSVSESGGIESDTSPSPHDADGSPQEQIIWGPQAPAGLAWTGGPVAWDGTMGGTDSYAWNLNNLSGCNGATSGEVLTGFDDWTNVKLNFKSNSNSADGVSVIEDAPDPANPANTITTGCNDTIDSFENAECVRELSGGVVNGGNITSFGTSFPITDNDGKTMKIMVNQAEITLADVLSHRENRFEQLKKEIHKVATDVNVTYATAYDKVFESVNPQDNVDFYKLIRILNRINHTMDSSLGGNSADDLIPVANQTTLTNGIKTIKLAFQLAAKYEPNVEHPAKFGGALTPRGQEFLGVSSDQVKCKNDDFTLVLNGQNDRPACITNGHLTQFENTAWVKGLVKIT